MLILFFWAQFVNNKYIYIYCILILYVKIWETCIRVCPGCKNKREYKKIKETPETCICISQGVQRNKETPGNMRTHVPGVQRRTKKERKTLGNTLCMSRRCKMHGGVKNMWLGGMGG
jgi:hypothetical protein